MYHMKVVMSETEMEESLAKQGYNIFTDEENCIDSIVVIEYALEKGYAPRLNTDTDEITFIYRTLWSIK